MTEQFVFRPHNRCEYELNVVLVLVLVGPYSHSTSPPALGIQTASFDAKIITETIVFRPRNRCRGGEKHKHKRDQNYGQVADLQQRQCRLTERAPSRSHPLPFRLPALAAPSSSTLCSLQRVVRWRFSVWRQVVSCPGCSCHQTN